MFQWIRIVPVIVSLAAVSGVQAQGRPATPHEGPASKLSQILGRPTDHGVAVSVLSASGLDVQVEYGTTPGKYTGKTPVKAVKAGVPVEIELTGLTSNAQYVYRLLTRATGASEFSPGPEYRFHTQRVPGEGFTFALQGDSHPERLGKMYDPDLYVQTMNNVSKDAPDFYFTMGDDFSIERLFERKNMSQAAVDEIYAHQRGFLGIVGRSTPLMLVNGNHEQAAKYLLDGTANNGAVFAGRARTNFYPLPAPGGIYTGNAEPVEHIGLLRDYYAWTWGDALFVVIDPYWHSDVPVDNGAGERAPQADAGRESRQPGEKGKRRPREGGGGGGSGGELEVEKPADAQPAGERGGKGQGGRGGRDLWQITLGDTQYQWLRTTLTQSKAKFKFVFSHHVLGTGRGGVEVADEAEWGGQDPRGGGRGVDRFFQMRPKWEKPIHDLMRDSGVTIFFQGHDHLYARQELDGVVYQEVPNPADSTFTAFNRQSYQSGDIFPNSGHLRVTIAPGGESAKVEYVLSFRPRDEVDGKKNGAIAHSYMVTPRVPKEAKKSVPPKSE